MPRRVRSNVKVYTTRVNRRKPGKSFSALSKNRTSLPEMESLRFQTNMKTARTVIFLAENSVISGVLGSETKLHNGDTGFGRGI